MAEQERAGGWLPDEEKSARILAGVELGHSDIR